MKKRFYFSGLAAVCFSLCTVAAKAQAPLAITTNPHDTTVCAGTNATFSVADTGTAPFTYVWKVSTDGGATWDTVVNNATYSGATTTTLTIATTASLRGNEYFCIVDDTDDEAASSRATLYVDTPVTAAPILGPTATCVGNTIHLTNANTEGTGIWSSSNGNASVSSTGMVTGVAHGASVISYSFTNACSSVLSTYTVNIDTLLGHGVISGDTALCAGSWISLSETISGGIWVVTNTAIATVDGDGFVTGVSAGSTDVVYYLSNACGASYATHSIEVSRTAAAIVGIDSVGIGATRTFTDSVSGGTWSSSDTLIATISASGVATGVATGTTTVSYTVTNACGTSVATKILNVAGAPSAGTITMTGTDSVCIGASKTLSDAVTGGVWNSSHDTVATVNASGIVTGVGTGSTTISYTVTNAFGSSTTTKVIYSHGKPNTTITGPTVVALGGYYTLVGTPAGGVFTENTDTMASLVGYGFLVVSGYGSVTVTYTATNTCGSVSANYTATLASPTNGVAIVNGNNDQLSVYPNPNNGAFTVNLSSNVKESAVVTVVNIAGQTVKTLTVNTNETANVNIDQPAGVYFLSATTASGAKYTARVTVAK